MGKKPMAPMAVSERAKQFMPFAAVRGLDEALRKKRLEMGCPEKGDIDSAQQRDCESFSENSLQVTD